MSILLRLLLVWLALAFAVMLWRSRRRQPRRKKQPQGIAAPQPMVACAHCALLLPRSEALLQDGHFYCCCEHMQHGNEKNS